MATFDYFPFESGDGAFITEPRWTDMFIWMRTVGVLSEDTTLAPDGELAVNPADPSIGTQIQVEDGEAFIQGFMFIQEDGPFVIDISLNDSGDPRVDLVVLRLDKTNDIISYFVIEGTPAMSPVVPDPIQNSTIWDLPLAEIAVADGATEITSMDITDVRVRSMQGDGGSSAVTLASAGGTTLVSDGVGPDLEVKGLTAGTNITITPSGTELTISASSTPTDSPICILTLSMNQTVGNGMADTIVWDTAIFDPDMMWDGMTDITIPEDGLYEVKVNVAWTGNVSSNGIVSAYAVSGVDTLTQNITLAVGNVSVSNNSSAIVDLSAMDVITVEAENNSGVSLDVDASPDVFPYVSVIKVRS